MEALQTPSGKGMIHAFFAERAVAKIPEAGATPPPVAKIGVIGGGTMGSGIATAALLGGLEVRLIEVAEDVLERGRATIEKNLDGAVKRGKISEPKRDAALARLAPSTDMQTLRDVDLVIEAGLQPYDIQAPIAVIEAAGGIVTDWQGGPAHMGGRALAAANPAIHAEALALLNA